MAQFWRPAQVRKQRSRLDGSSIVSLWTSPEGCPETVLIRGGQKNMILGGLRSLVGSHGSPEELGGLEDQVGHLACTKTLDLGSWIYKDTEDATGVGFEKIKKTLEG